MTMGDRIPATRRPHPAGDAEPVSTTGDAQRVNADPADTPGDGTTPRSGPWSIPARET